MSKIIDRFGIINTTDVKGNIDDIMTFIDNILNDNIVYHPIILDQLLDQKIDYESLLYKINTLLDTYNRNNRIVFRKQIKQNTFICEKLFDYIYKYVNILRILNSYLYKTPLSISKYDSSFRWGTSTITKQGIESMINIIFKDKIIIDIINLNCNDYKSVNKLFRTIKYLNSYSDIYDYSIDILDKTLIAKTEEAIVDNGYTSEKLKNNMVCIIQNIKMYLNDYTKYKNEFKYIKGIKIDTFLNSYVKKIINYIKEFVTLADINSTMTFINTFGKQLCLLKNHDIFAYLTYNLMNVTVKNNNIIYNSKINESITIDQILNLLNVYKKIFNDDAILKVILCKISPKLFSTDKIIQDIVEKIHYQICTLNNDMIDTFIECSNYIQNKDLFFKMMEVKFIQRIIYSTNNYIDHLSFEEKVISKLLKFHSKSEMFKYLNLHEDYKMYMEDSNKIVYFMTENMWDINITNGYGNINQINGNFTKTIKEMSELRILEQSNEQIDIFVHYDIGYVDINIINNTGRVNVKMSPIQLLCFELFANDKQYKKEDLLNSFKKNCITYKDEYLEKVIRSLVDSNLLVCNNNIYSENKEFNIQGFNFITTLNYICNTKQDIMSKIEEQLSYSRNEIIDSNINSLLKYHKTLSKDMLYKHCKDTIKLFTIDTSMFNKCISSMIDRDYIKMNDNGEYMKLLY